MSKNSNSEGEEEEILLHSVNHLNSSGKLQLKDHEGITTRLEVYSDAIFSIIATITILPVLEMLRDKEGTFEEIMDFIFLYFVSFQFIVLYYREHNFKFNRLLRFELSDVLVNALFLLVLGLFPFVTMMLFEWQTGGGEEGTSEEEKKREINSDTINELTPIFAQICVVVLTSFINLFTTLWIEAKSPFDPQSAFGYVRIVRKKDSLLNVAFGATIRFGIYLTGCITVVLLALIGLKEFSLSGYLICPLLFFLNRFFLLRIDRTKEFDGDDLSRKQIKRIRKEGVFFQKERALAFSDGIFAIAATIVAVNLRPPSADEISDDTTLFNAIIQMWPQFLSYIVSFFILAFWWFLNWRMIAVLHEKISFVSHVLNLQFLCFVGALPAVAELEVVYAGQEEFPNAVRIYCVLVISIGMIQLLMWITIIKTKHVKVTERYRNLVFTGILLAPATTVPAFILSFFSECTVCLYLAFGSFLIVPFAGLICYIIFTRKVEKKERESSIIVSHVKE